MNNIKILLILFLAALTSSCVKKADHILKQETFLPGPGAYLIEIDDSKNPNPDIRTQVKTFMTSLLASTPNCLETNGKSKNPDYVIQIQYQHTPGCDSSTSQKGMTNHSLEVQILKTSDNTVFYQGSIVQNCTNQEFQASLQSMLQDLIKKQSENTGRSMKLQSSFRLKDT